MRIVGVDLSLTATGIAVLDEYPYEEPFLHTISSSADNGTVHSRLLRLNLIKNKVLSYCSGADLIVIEAPSYNSKGGHQWDRAGLWWLFVDAVHEECSNVVQVAPTVLKKWATGSGNAGKTAVALGIHRIWPHSDIRNDNEADALCLASMGANAVGKLSYGIHGTHRYQKEMVEQTFGDLNVSES